MKTIYNFKKVKGNLEEAIFDNYHNLLEIAINAILIEGELDYKKIFTKIGNTTYNYKEEDIILENSTDADEYIYSMLNDLNNGAFLYVGAEGKKVLNPNIMKILAKKENFWLALAANDLGLSLYQTNIPNFVNIPSKNAVKSIEEFAQLIRQFYYNVKITSKILKIGKEFFCFYELN